MQSKLGSGKTKVILAGGAVASAAAAANAAIVYHDPVDVTISGRTTQSAFLDLTGGTISTTEQSGVSDLVFIVGAEGTSKPYTYLNRAPSSTTGALITGGISLTEGTLVQSAIDTEMVLLPFGSTGNYYGFSFVEGGTTMYGWVRAGLVITDNEPEEAEDFHTLTVRDWAYETSGAPIEVGAVPEPSSAAMMAVLAGSAALYRRRARKETAA